MISKTVYVADDGTIFNEAGECFDYEKRVYCDGLEMFRKVDNDFIPYKLEASLSPDIVVIKNAEAEEFMMNYNENRKTNYPSDVGIWIYDDEWGEWRDRRDYPQNDTIVKCMFADSLT